MASDFDFKDFKKGQVTIFIIIALVIIGGILLYIVLKGGSLGGKVPAKFEGVENYFLDCVKEKGEAGISILSERGGYIYPPDFIPGNDYSVTGNQLDFFGTGIPYWYYFSGNNIVKEQMPSKSLMQRHLEKYLEENLECDFSKFIQDGYDVNLSGVTADVQILDNKVRINLRTDFNLGFVDEKVRVTNHEIEINSKLGNFYNQAVEIYNKEKDEAFLEDYAIDALYLYAPVTGVELTCSPKIWFLEEVQQELAEATEANTMMLKVKGDYYELQDEKNKYFVTDITSDDEVRFLYSSKWPTKINVDGNENGLLIGEPVGNQEGLGIIGFCYVPYHFVYDMAYPVLVQIYDSQELFQFPVVVSVEGNQKRTNLATSSVSEREVGLCKYKNNEMKVYTYNTKLEGVEADISFKCFNENCDIGKTKFEGDDAVLAAAFPQCLNGFIAARADGYEDKKFMISTNQGGIADIVLDKVHNLSVDLLVNQKISADKALIYFKSDDTSTALSWPEQKEIKLSEGSYNITVYVYKNASIKIPASTNQKCVDIPKPGLLGLFGQKTEQCFDLTIPGQELDSVVIGGGKTSWYVSESELEENNIMDVNVFSLSVPNSLEQLQDNYNKIDENPVYLEFRK